MVRTALLAALLSLAGCGSGEQAAGEGRPASRENVVLYVSNQSFERATVDIEVVIDGSEVVDDDFAVGNQHNWVEYRLGLGPGRHALRVSSGEGGAALERSFTVAGRTWLVVDYWCCDDGPSFTLHLSRQPVAFA